MADSNHSPASSIEYPGDEEFRLPSDWENWSSSDSEVGITSPQQVIPPQFPNKTVKTRKWVPPARSTQDIQKKLKLDRDFYTKRHAAPETVIQKKRKLDRDAAPETVIQKKPKLDRDFYTKRHPAP